MKKSILLGSVCLMGIAAQAEIVAGWDLLGVPPGSAAQYTAAGITANQTLDYLADGVSTNIWTYEWGRRDADGTFGSVEPGAATTGRALRIDTGPLALTSSAGYLEFAVSNGGTTDYDLKTFSFDAWATWGSMDNYTVSLVAGDLGLATLGTGSFAKHGLPGDSGTGDYDDFDVDISGYTLAAGQSATFRLDFVDNSPSGGNKFYLDNIAVVAIPEPASLGLIAMACLGLVAARRMHI